MSGARQFDRSSYLKLKAATRRLNKQVGGQEAAASLTRVDVGRLCRYGLAHDPSFMPVDVVADLESDAGDLIVTKILAGLNGHLVVPVPVVCKRTDWIAQLEQV